MVEAGHIVRAQFPHEPKRAVDASCEPGLFEHGSVSYTHLDVYKRQSLDRSLLRLTALELDDYVTLADITSIFSSFEIMEDVYKRQGTN